MTDSQARAAYVAKSSEYLGKGVNIFAEQYLGVPTGKRVVDVNGNVDVTPIRQTDAVETYGSNFAEFVSEFSVKAGLEGSYGGFTASIESKFAKSTLDSIDTKFAQLSLISSGEELSLGTDPRVLKKYLNEDFKKALAEDDPTDLFRAYGTHVAVKVKLGGMLSYYSYSSTTIHQSQSEFEFSAKAKYKGYGAEVGANGELTEKEKEAAKKVEGSDHLFVNGGSDVARTKVEKGNKESYAAWAATIGEYPGFLGFTDGGLFPVWKLTDSAERAEALQLAFKEMAARQFQVRIFKQTGLSDAHPQARIRIPDGYKLLCGGAFDGVDGAITDNMLTASYPDGDNTWVGRGKDHKAHSPAQITVYALGIYDNLDIWETSQVSATGESGPRPTAEVALSPDFVAKGGVRVGGGARVDWDNQAGNLLTNSCPKGSTAWVAGAKDHIFPGDGRMTVFALGLRCKLKSIKLEVQTKSATSAPKAHPSEKTSPNVGFTLTGGGAAVDYGQGQGSLLTSSYPEDADTWAVSSKDHIEHSVATITAYALGLKVT